MAAPYGMPPSYGHAPRVRFEAIGEAWQMLVGNFGVWVPAMLLVVVVAYGVSTGLMFLVGAAFGLQVTLLGISPNPGLAVGMSIGFFFTMLAVGVLSGLLNYVLFGGITYMGVKQARGEPIQITDMFAGFSQFGNLLLAYILVQLLIMAGFMLCIIPGLIMQGLLMLVVPIVMDQRVSAVQAVQMSFDALKREWWLPILFLIVVGILSGLGVLACGVGIFFTLPLFFISLGIVYRDFFLGAVPPTYSTGPYQMGR